MQNSLVSALALGAALSTIIAERRDAFGSADALSDSVDELVHSGQAVTIDAIAASVTGAPFDDSTLPGLHLPDAAVEAQVIERFVRCGQMSAILLERRSFYGSEDAHVEKLAGIVHAEQKACFALLTAQPAGA